MAEAPDLESMEDDKAMKDELKRLLQTEANRRHQFIGQLHDLEFRWKRKSQHQEEEEASVIGLMEKLQRTDDIVTLMLLEFQRLWQEDVSRREKEPGSQRDSGFTPSSDLGVVKRQAVYKPVTDSDGDGFGETGQPSSSIKGDLKDLRQSGEPTQHTDESSDTESN